MPESPRIEELKRRVQLDPASIAFAALAEEFRRAGRHEEAIEVCRTGLQRHPSYISAHVTLGRALLETGKYDDARRELEYVLSVAPENLAAIRGLAEIHHRHGQSSSESTDLTATEMANMLAVPHPSAPPVTTRPEPLPPPVHAPPPVDEQRVPEPQPEPEAVPQPEPPVIELVQLEPVIELVQPERGIELEQPEPVIELEAPEPEVVEIVEPEPAPVETFGVQAPVFEIVPPPDMAAPAPPPARAAIVTAFEPRKADPALERLEAFLHAILRARESAGIHVS